MSKKEKALAIKKLQGKPGGQALIDAIQSGQIKSSKSVSYFLKHGELGGVTTAAPFMPSPYESRPPPVAQIPINEGPGQAVVPSTGLMPDSTLPIKEAIVEAKSGPTILNPTPFSTGSMSFTDSIPFPLDGDLTESDSPAVSPIVLVAAAAVLLFVVMR